ncbi:unnamed protein product [Mucor hiemalis]
MAEAKMALLYWVRSQLEDYVEHHIITTVQDFSRSWRSGLAFCLLVHRHDPNLIPTLFTEHIKHASEKDTWNTLLILAFDIAAQSMNIPKYLEPADLLGVDYPHEPSVMMYVSEFYKVMSQNQKEEDEPILEKKRLHDISLVSPVFNSRVVSDHDGLSVNTPHHQSITPPDSTTTRDDEEEEEELPSTPQPELVLDDDVYQQLDTLSLLLTEHPEEKEIEQQLLDNQKSRLILDHANRVIDKLDPSSEEKLVLSNRYNQLRSEWETLSKKLQLVQHTSNYVNESDETMYLKNQLKECNISIHPLDGTTDMAEEFERAVSHISKLIDADTSLSQNESVVADFVATESACQLFRRGITFLQLTSAINDELGVVQQLMSNSGKNAVTDDLIRSLEQRIHVVNTTIQGVREEYGPDILLYDTGKEYFDRFVNRIDDIEDRYEVVRDWVDQVRVWFLEAERIRAWIDKQIHIIEERNEADTFNPISRDITIADEIVIQIHEEHEKLKHEIDHFDSDDMNRLRAHVKMLTPTKEDEFSNQRQELTPADTSTIEITLTTLNMLNHLTHLLNKRSHLIELLLLRVKWEDLFGNAVQWIAHTDGELDAFLKGKARWSEKEESSYTSSSEDDNDDDGQGIESVIKTLVSLERKIADFDGGAYSDVLDAYQEMEALKNDTLPDYLEMRQLGFEKAFEDLMKRSGFSRKVVEQLLSMINTVEKFKELRDVGETLRRQLSNDAEDKVAHDDMYAEQVQAFKEDSARLITNASTNIPYPSVPEMSTAIGANDAHDNQVTNENIRSNISAYSMSLALIADGLDQLLTSRYQLVSLQERAKDASDAMSRVKLWMNERIKLLEKSRFDLMLYGDQNQSSSDSTSLSEETSSASNNTSAGTTTNFIADDENLHRLEKERDSIAVRLQQIEYDELSKLFDTVRALEYDVDASNAVSIDRDLLVNAVESLEKTHQQLKDMLDTRGLQLDTLKKRIDWETQWSKSNSHLHTIARKLCDFNVKKARYDPGKENTDKPSYANDRENLQSLQFIQDRVTELSDRHFASLYECYQDMLESYSRLSQDESSVNSGLPDLLTIKQATLKFEYDDLKHLLSYTSDLLTQRATMTEFLLRAHDAQHEGEKIKDVVSKKIRRIMTKEEEDGSTTTLDSRVVAFKQEVKSIWQDCGNNMPFPVYNGNWLRSTTNSTANGPQSPSKGPNEVTSTSNNNAAGLYRSQVRSQIKALMDRKMEELKTLEKSIDQSLGMYQEADHMKSLVSQYEQEACQLGQWINEQIETLKSQHIDVSAESFLAREMNISDLKKSRLDLYIQADTFEGKKVKALHDQIARLVEDSVEKKKNQSVDVSSAARHLGEVMNQLSQLKRGLSDQAVTLEAASRRAEWEDNLKLGITKLEEMNEQLRLFNIKKNQWIIQDELSQHHVNTLQQDLSNIIGQKNKFEKTILPSIQLSYDAFVEYFPKLSRPIATPDHLEARMDSLSRTSLRFQENVAARSKELDLIKQRIRWEDTVKQALAYLSEKELLIENFVEEKARWNNNSSVEDIVFTRDDDEEAKLRNEWHNLYSDIKKYEEDVIAPLQKRFNSLVDKSTDHYNNTNVTVFPAAFTKKIQDIQTAQSRADYFLDFSNEVVSQRCLVSAFILRTAQLEQSAELIREEFIATKVAGAGNQIAGLLEGHTERLQKFKAGIEDVRQNLASSIPYPVRSLENMSTQAKIRDETTNSVILETIDLRNTRLDEICISLQQLLESKERVSRRKLSLHSFKKQAEVTEAWIDSRRELLSRSNYLIDHDEQKVDVDKLKEAVSQADSVEQSMKANETVFTSLVTLFDRCISAFEDKSLDEEKSQDEEDFDMGSEITNVVKPTQSRIGQDWNNLLLEAGETTRSRTALLIENRILAWFDALNVLASNVESSKNEEDEQISMWSDELNKYEQELQALNNDVELNKSVFIEKQAANIETRLTSGLDLMKAVRSKLLSLQNELHLNQLINQYLADIANLESAIQSEIHHLTKTNEAHTKIDGESTSNDREAQHQHLISEYKIASDNVTDLKDSNDNVHNQYNVILIKNDTYKDNKINLVSEKWQALLSLETTVSALVSRSSKWLKYFDYVQNIRKDLEAIQIKLEKAESYVDAEKDTKYKELNTKLEEVDSALKSDVCKLLDELISDTINSQQYNLQKSSCSDLKDLLQRNLDQRMTDREKLVLTQSITAIIRRLCKECDEQLDLVQKHSHSYDFSNVESKEDVQLTISACSGIVKATSLLQSSIKTELDSVRLNQCHHLVTNLGCTDDEAQSLILPVTQSLEKLYQLSNSEEECISVSTMLSEYMLLYSTFVDTITPCISRQASETPTSETLLHLKNQLEILDQNKKQLSNVGQKIINFDFADMSNLEKRKANIFSLIETHKQDVDTKYDTLVKSIDESSLEVEKMRKRQQIISKLNDLITYVGNTTDRVNSLQLSGKSSVSASEERELKELCQDFYQTLEAKTKACDALMANFENATTDEEIIELKQRLASDIDALKSLISYKEKEASDEGDISEFLNILNEFDQHITILTAAIENASPHHSSMVNGKFVKSDLQGLLRSLVATYKEHKEIITVILEKASVESKKQFLGDNERVKQNTQRASKKWTQVQAAAAARERELQTCIGSLDHEFFTKLAMAKSTKKPRTVIPQQQPSLPLKRQPTPSNGRYLGATSPFPRRSIDDSSRRPSKTPLSASSSNSRISRAAYISDPKNPLDMQLGHIVNSYPHRITVKIVAGQVGKYWFGDENPRLVYCRILPSKLVMVRVGGGWVELSKFLREHGLTDGSHSRPASSQESIKYNNHENAPFLESYIQTLRSSSPSGRVTIRGGGGVSNSAASTRSSSKSSGSRSRSPLPGFVDGDKFISLDEAGNHVVVKMKKADIDAKTPIIKKKDKN